MKGIILAGGTGTRLRPATLITNKHLLPIINKPMILYPLETLKHLGCEDILVISGGNHIGSIAEFLGDGAEYGVNLSYRVQKQAGGIAQAIGLAENFAAKEKILVILGDNIFENVMEQVLHPEKCQIWIKAVKDPSRFGVYDPGRKRIVEKPKNPATSLAVTGLYYFTPDVFDIIKTLKPSARSELEVTDINNFFLKCNDMNIGTTDGFWSDAGTPQSLLEAIDFAKKSMIS